MDIGSRGMHCQEASWVRLVAWGMFILNHLSNCHSAKAGIHTALTISIAKWILAFAGMTTVMSGCIYAPSKSNGA
jgi:hypothetical protein